MNTLLFISQDTITNHVVKVVGSCQPCVQEAETNWADVSIANTICGNLFGIAVVCVVGVLAWKLLGIIEQRWADCCKRKWDFKELKWKQKSDLINKLLDFLKEKASEKNDNSGKKPKNHSLPLSPNDIYSLLKSNASKSCAEDLRQRYVELCVDALQNIKAENPSNDGTNNNTKDVSPKTDVKSKGFSDAQKAYIHVLLLLIDNVHKSEFNKDDLDELRKSCGIETKNPNPDPNNDIKHEKKES